MASLLGLEQAELHQGKNVQQSNCYHLYRSVAVIPPGISTVLVDSRLSKIADARTKSKT